MKSDSASKCQSSGIAREVLALNLIRLRAQRQWSQETLAFESGLHRTFVAHVERQVRNISLDNVERLANAFGLKVFELLTPMRQQLPPERTLESDHPDLNLKTALENLSESG